MGEVCLHPDEEGLEAAEGGGVDTASSPCQSPHLKVNLRIPCKGESQKSKVIPDNSPDVMLIENVFARMKQILTKQTCEDHQEAEKRGGEGMEGADQ